MTCMCAFFFACALAMFPCWQACNLSSFSLLLHWLHESSPRGALTPCHNSSPSNLHQGTVFTGAPKADCFREVVQMPDAVRARRANSPQGQLPLGLLGCGSEGLLLLEPLYSPLQPPAAVTLVPRPFAACSPDAVKLGNRTGPWSPLLMPSG